MALKSPAINPPRIPAHGGGWQGSPSARYGKGVCPQGNQDERLWDDRQWLVWMGDNVHGKRTPPILAGEFEAENGTKQGLPPSLDPNYLLLLWLQVECKALARQQRHVRKRYSLERRLLPSVRHQKGFANFRIVQNRCADFRRNFLKKDDFGTLVDSSKFCVMRENRDLRAGFCSTCFDAYLEHSRLDDLKAERVCSLCW